MHKQKGLTLISWLIIIGIVVFNGILALNVVPVYMNDHSVKTLVNNLELDSTVRGKTPKALKEIITKRLRINNVYSVTKENITIKKSGREYLIIVEYEPRGRLMGNLDYIVTFKHEARVPAN